MLAFGRVIIPERGVAQGMAEGRIIKLYARVGRRSISLLVTNCLQMVVVKVT